MSLKRTDVTKALKFFVGMSGVYSVDNDGYIKNTAGEVVKIGNKTDPKDLMVFNEVITNPNAAILNPFAEGLGETDDQYWFYESFSMSFSIWVTQLIKFISENAVVASNKKSKADLPVELVSMVSPYAELVDKKTEDELEKIMKDVRSFMNVVYKRKSKTAVFRCAVFEGPSFREQFPGVRKKTWDFLELVLSHIFKTPDPTSTPYDKILDEYSYTTEVIGCPKIDAVMHIYYMLAVKLNPYYELMDKFCSDETSVREYAIDLSTFSYHLNNLNEYYQLARHIIQPNTVKQATPAQQNMMSTVPAPMGVGGMMYSTVPVPNNSGFNLSPNVPVPSNMGMVPVPQMPYPQAYSQSYTPQVQVSIPMTPQPMPGMGMYNPMMGNVPMPMGMNAVPNQFGMMGMGSYGPGVYPNPNMGMGVIGGFNTNPPVTAAPPTVFK